MFWPVGNPACAYQELTTLQRIFPYIAEAKPREMKMKKVTGILLAACVASTLAPLTVLAQEVANQGNWVNPNKIVWKDPYGLCWRSGSWTPAMATAECDPYLIKAEAPIPPVAQAEPPAPEPAPAPDKFVNRKISLSADALFDFDKAKLKPAGKVLLDDMARDLRDVKYDTIEAVGHTDRIGSPRYNQKLSVQRANSVKTYLEGTGIPADRIRATGKGETQPVTKAGECKGPKSKKVIACLQPDRRVDVEVSGGKEVRVSSQ